MSIPIQHHQGGITILCGGCQQPVGACACQAVIRCATCWYERTTVHGTADEALAWAREDHGSEHAEHLTVQMRDR